MAIVNRASHAVLALAILSVVFVLVATAVQAAVTKPIIAKDPASAQYTKAQNCSDGIQNQDELAVDCAGVCATSAKEVCDGVDNDKDCYVDEGGVCEVSSSQSSNDDLCAFPNKQIGYENNPDYFAIKSPTCIIEDDVGSLKYLSTLNLTKSLNSNRAQKETLQSIVALYQLGEGRCSAIFTAYPAAAAAKEAAKDTESPFMPLKRSGNNYLYINQTEGVGYWVKGNYLVTITSFDYISHHKWEENCTELLSAYLARIGSDLSPASQAAAGEKDSTIVKTSPPTIECRRTGDDSGDSECWEVSSAVGAGRVPDEEGMVMDCSELDENGAVLCKKVKASELPPSAGPVEEEAASADQGGQLASQSAAAAEESQTEKIRRIAKKYDVYLSNYSDKQLLDALQKFSKKHKEELEEKYSGQEPSEEKFAEILKQFSQEEFGNKAASGQQASQQPQKQSLFSKIAGFFKKLF